MVSRRRTHRSLRALYQSNQNARTSHQLISMENEDEDWIFSGSSPGRFMNIMPIDPSSDDSDLDGTLTVGNMLMV